MGLFDFKKKKEILLGAPVEGECVPLSQVSDPTFRDEILGKGVAFQALDGKVFAPADGEVSTVFPTGHAVSLVADCGAEILIHVGLETVSLEGKPFTIHAANGDKVKKGQLLIEVDLKAVEAAGLKTITPMVVCNTDNYPTFQTKVDRDVTNADVVIQLAK